MKINFLRALVCTVVFVAGASRAWADAAATQVNYDFCTLDGQSEQSEPSLADPTAPQIWDAASVQAYARALTHDPAIVDTPWAAYPIVYVALTHERDVQRCGGTLSIPDRQSRLIGDLLADVMSRWLMLSVAACEDDAPFGDQQTGICPALQRIKGNDFDALRSAVEMTAVYLTSHMGMALVAVIQDDPFWNQEFDVSTHCTAHPCAPDVMSARLAVVQQYKPGYDLNNEFLAKNFTLVIGSLTDACYLDGGLFTLGSEIADQLPTGSIFGNIRDRTFAAALTTAQTLAPEDHPMLTQTADGLTHIQYDHFATFAQYPSA